eukprot:UN34664
MFIKIFMHQFHHIKVVKPTKEMLEKQDTSHSAMFKYFPELREKICCIKMGDFPTPVHKVHVTFKGKKSTIFLKREDMVNHENYAGNKVRTMEFQFANAVEKLKKTGGKLYSVGGLGSNQSLITTVYSDKRSIKQVSYLNTDEGSSMDNSLNLLSGFSFENVKFVFSSLPMTFWDLWNVKPEDCIIAMGGNSKLGQMGQIGGFLELCDQVKTFDNKIDGI